ncbi:uncharacterized protein LOC141898762 [Tubulanus polymorphus]|uniref:uncharacterized protein LOC141898762 n=1 Tax=Tubulanus polymorphus TaxID=672921 RepID=UPI003DA62AB3
MNHSSDHPKKSHKRHRVGPMSTDESLHYENPAYVKEIPAASGDTDDKINNKKKLNLIDFPTRNALNLISNVKQGASRWMEYATNKRIIKRKVEEKGLNRSNTGGVGLSELEDDFSPSVKDTTHQMIVASNRTLLQYFARLGATFDMTERLDLEFVYSLFRNGARLDCCDKYGQTIFHEVARAWHPDVAKFLIENGADVNICDTYDRTPLHVAAAVDYPEMCKFLIENGANKEARTKGENQTPVHFAARNDACHSLKMLIKLDCEYKKVVDYKNRTPVHVAAELDRSETARLLLEMGAPADGVDSTGQRAIVWMITKMAPVAKEALDQFHITDRANRKQYFFLNKLEHEINSDTGNSEDNASQTTLEVIVAHKQFDLVTHTSVQRLIDRKWCQFGKFGAWYNLIYNLVFIILWTCLATIEDWRIKHTYKFPYDAWRVVVLCTASLMTLHQVVMEILEIRKSKVAHEKWKRWRLKEIARDEEYCHPQWPEEKMFLNLEKEDMDKLKPQYFNDFWNIFDWLCYFLIIVVLVTHFVDVANHNHLLALWHNRINAVNIIMLWLRLMKNARAFSSLGPFIVIVGSMFGDIVKFAFLYLVFYIPYVCAFWMILGGENPKEVDIGTPRENITMVVDGFQNFNALLFTMFRLTLVDEYQYNDMKLVDSLMTDILVGTWLAVSAIICLNLFIALMSDTFQRVYDNANANAIMQKAITILNIQDSLLPGKYYNRFQYEIQTECAPECLYYDDDLSTDGEDELKKVTLQLKDDMDEVMEILNSNFKSESTDGGSLLGAAADDVTGSNRVTVQKFENEVDLIREEVREIFVRQNEIEEKLHKDLMMVHSTLQSLLISVAGGGGGAGSSHQDIVDGRLYDRAGPFQPSTATEQPAASSAASETSRRREKRQRERKHRGAEPSSAAAATFPPPASHQVSAAPHSAPHSAPHPVIDVDNDTVSRPTPSTFAAPAPQLESAWSDGDKTGDDK